MSNDDILNARIRKDLLKKDWNVPRDYHGRRMMKDILDIIMRYNDLDVGISHQELAESTGMDRKTIRPYLKRLIKRGLVTRDQGKHGKYFLTTKRHRGTVISAEILAESFREKFLNAFEEIFVLDSPYFKRNIPYNDIRFDLEDALFNFSNIVGGWITYVLIQSMNPTNYPTDDVKDNVEKKLSVAAFIEDAISLIQPYLLLFFNYYVSVFLGTLHKKVQGMKGGFSTSNQLKVFFDIVFKGKLFDEGSVSELNEAFSNVYPNLSHELEKTRLELPALIRHEIDERRRFSEEIRKQENCKPHDYVPLPDDRDKDYSTFRCRKCRKLMKKRK